MIQVLVLCSFVACLPTTLGISCYSCAEYPGSSETCSSLSIISCDSFYDSCMTTIVTGEVHGYQYSTTVKDCSISSTCDSNLICNQVNSSISQSNGTMFSCSVNCCDSDLCNGGGPTEYPTGGPLPTRYPTGGPLPTGYPTGRPLPTGYPTSGPEPSGFPTAGPPGPDPQSRLKYYIHALEALLRQMEYIVDNELGAHPSISAKKRTGRNKKRSQAQMKMKTLRIIKENVEKMFSNKE
ncbi:unnamed protein product [Porites lobata]|uniref:Uncharacterized protein n=1 Tax=Porites lobata TaxID=104759 RepID=A0ABN8RJG3_9CNID|nr:unnamed protein product [Porites lobata]